MSLIEFELTFGADNEDGSFGSPLLVITSIRGGTNPYISDVPTGDGASYDPVSMASQFGVYNVQIADWDIGSHQRIITHILESGGLQQHAYRRMRLRERVDGGAWRVLSNGVLTLLKLISGAKWQCQISDPMAAGVVSQLFAPDPDPDTGVTIADFLDAWPMRGCLLGGPISTASGNDKVFGGIQDRGGWTMKVKSSSLTGQYWLTPVAVYGPTDYWSTKDRISDELAIAINDQVARIQVSIAKPPITAGQRAPWTRIGHTQRNYYAWPGLVVLVRKVSESAWKAWKPLPNTYSAAAPGGVIAPTQFIAPNGSEAFAPGLHVIDDSSDGSKTLTDGELVRVRVITILPSEISPIYVADHPAEIKRTFWDITGIPKSDDAIDDLKNAIGGDARYAMRITGPEDLTSLSADVNRAFGIAERANDDGDVEPFLGRAINASAPLRVVDATCVAKGSTVVPFELDPSKALRTIVYRQSRFSALSTDPSGPLDQVQTLEESQAALNGDVGARMGSVEIATRGMRYSVGSSALSLADIVQAIGGDLFPRFGRGPVAVETTFLRGADIGGGETTDDVKLGREILFQIPQLPNANYRLGDNNAISGRAMQLVRRTIVPAGYAVRLVDSGPNAAPFATVPTITLAASSDAPRTVAELTITNASTLNAAGASVRVQWAVTSGSTPSASDYTDLLVFGAGVIPTGAIELPAVPAGGKVYTHVRAEKAGSRPSSYSSGANVTLTGIGQATSLTATPSGTDGSQSVLAWSTTGNLVSTDVVDVYLRFAGDAFSKAWRVRELAFGSVQFGLTNLTPDENYIATIQYRDPATNDVGAAVDVSFTTDASIITLDPPLYPRAFTPLGSSGRPGLTLPVGIGIGLAVVGIPGTTVAFEVAVETSVGSDTPGAYSEFATAAAAPSTWTAAAQSPPHDNLARWLRARTIGDGSTSSGYTTPLKIRAYNDYLPLADPQPSVDLTASDVPGDMVSISYMAVGDAEYKIDTGTYAPPPSNPFTIAKLEGGDQTVFVRSKLFGLTSPPASVAIPRVPGASPPVTITSLGISVSDESTDTFEIDYGITGSPHHVDVAWSSTSVDGGAEQSLGDVSSPATFTSALLNPQTGGGVPRSVTAHLKLYDASNALLASSSSEPLSFEGGPIS